ncbi:MAG: DUF924 domain-containing protein [Alphaproteobacteria bacterium]|nr:DUF924 domain-containing protein [Alphaproteobacteria bacterium]
MRDSKHEVLHFWFEEVQPSQWFQKNESFDDLIRDRFMGTYRLAADGVCDLWRDEAEGALALCVVLDQFPRNMFRGAATAFASDVAALRVAKQAIVRGFDQMMTPTRRRFLYLPFEHSEALADQETSLKLFGAMREDDPLGYDYAARHYEIIQRFGRFPHRNAILGRQNTPDEEEYLAHPGAGF